MPIVQSRKMSHIALNVTDVERQLAFYTEMAGFSLTAVDDRGNAYLRCNTQHHSVMLIPSSESGVDHIALSVGGAAELDAAASALARAGISHDTSPPEKGQGPAVRLRDPDGIVVELVGELEQAPAVYGPRAVQPRKFGHVTIHAKDIRQSMAFYEEVLGFRASDWLGDLLAWARCNPDHHGMAFVNVGKRGLHHFAMEVRDIGELVQQSEHLARNGRRVVFGPGRHGPGDNLFIYFRDLEANLVEFTCDVQQIWNDATHVAKSWQFDESPVNLWGPEPPADFL